jgi:hypothetical protein
MTGSIVALSALHFVQLLSLVPWVLMAFMTIFLFDAPAPGLREEIFRSLFVLAIVSYPVVMLVVIVASWVLLFRGKRLASFAITGSFTGLMLVAGVAIAITVGLSS